VWADLVSQSYPDVPPDRARGEADRRERLRTWILAQDGRDDPVGHLARLLRSRTRPQRGFWPEPDHVVFDRALLQRHGVGLDRALDMAGRECFGLGERAGRVL